MCVPAHEKTSSQRSVPVPPTRVLVGVDGYMHTCLRHHCHNFNHVFALTHPLVPHKHCLYSRALPRMHPPPLTPHLVDMRRDQHGHAGGSRAREEGKRYCDIVAYTHARERDLM